MKEVLNLLAHGDCNTQDVVITKVLCSSSLDAFACGFVNFPPTICSNAFVTLHALPHAWKWYWVIDITRQREIVPHQFHIRSVTNCNNETLPGFSVSLRIRFSCLGSMHCPSFRVPSRWRFSDRWTVWYSSSQCPYLPWQTRSHRLLQVSFKLNLGRCLLKMKQRISNETVF